VQPDRPVRREHLDSIAALVSLTILPFDLVTLVPVAGGGAKMKTWPSSFTAILFSRQSDPLKPARRETQIR
jgi:hypothetical protein